MVAMGCNISDKLTSDDIGSDPEVLPPPKLARPAAITISQRWLLNTRDQQSSPELKVFSFLTTHRINQSSKISNGIFYRLLLVIRIMGVE